MEHYFIITYSHHHFYKTKGCCFIGTNNSTDSAILLVDVLANPEIFFQESLCLRHKDILYRSGWLIQQLSVCPFNRIQHCSINSGPFERKLGLASLSVYTAGTDGADIKIPGLKEETALALRDFIMKKTTANEQATV